MVKPIGFSGRRKVEMKKIQNRAKLGVTFSKRRNGIFKKSYELVTLCDAHLAVIIFSPGKKAYSFGHPDVFTVVNRLFQHFTNDDDFFALKNDKQKENMNQLIEEYRAVQVEAEIERISANSDKGKEVVPEMPFPPPNEFNRDESSRLHSLMMEFKSRLSLEIQKRVCMDPTNAAILNGGDAGINIFGLSSPGPILESNPFGVGFNNLGFANNHGVDLNNVVIFEPNDSGSGSTNHTSGASGSSNFTSGANAEYGVGSNNIVGPEESVAGPSKNGDVLKNIGSTESVNMPSSAYGTWDWEL